MASVLANISWCALLGSAAAVEMFIVWTPLILIGWAISRARDKEYREGRRKGVKQSNGFLDWMFHKD